MGDGPPGPLVQSEPPRAELVQDGGDDIGLSEKFPHPLPLTFLNNTCPQCGSLQIPMMYLFTQSEMVPLMDSIEGGPAEVVFLVATQETCQRNCCFFSTLI